MHKILSFLLVSILVCSACVRRPSGVLSDNEMVPVVVDLELAEAYLKDMHGSMNDNQKKGLMEYVLDKHGLTQAEFDSTMAWYGRNADMYYELCDKVEKELLVRQRKTIGKNPIIGNVSENLWPYYNQSFMSRLSGSNALEFSFPVADLSAGDRLNFKFRINALTDGATVFGVEYEDGVKSYLYRDVTSSKRVEMSLQTDSAKRVNRVFGHFLVSDAGRLPIWLDSISLTKLPFDSMQYYNIHLQRSFKDPLQR